MNSNTQEAVFKSLKSMTLEQLEAVFTVAKILSLGDSEDSASHDLLAMTGGRLALKGYFSWQFERMENRATKLLEEVSNV